MDRDNDPPPIQIEIANLQTILDPEKLPIKDLTRTLLEAEQVSTAEISLVFVMHDQMRALNKEHLNHDYNTDVLSFLLDSTGSADTHDLTIEGEVIIATEMAFETAAHLRESGQDWSTEDETLLYLTHGLLHLCGYDDRSPADQAVMRARERFHLKRWNRIPFYDEGALSEAASNVEGES